MHFSVPRPYLPTFRRRPAPVAPLSYVNAKEKDSSACIKAPTNGPPVDFSGERSNSMCVRSARRESCIAAGAPDWRRYSINYFGRPSDDDLIVRVSGAYNINYFVHSSDDDVTMRVSGAANGTNSTPCTGTDRIGTVSGACSGSEKSGDREGSSGAGLEKFESGKGDSYGSRPSASSDSEKFNGPKGSEGGGSEKLDGTEGAIAPAKPVDAMELFTFEGRFSAESAQQPGR